MIEARPETFKGTPYEWGQLMIGLLTPPDPQRTWVKDKQGVWNRE